MFIFNSLFLLRLFLYKINANLPGSAREMGLKIMLYVSKVQIHNLFSNFNLFVFHINKGLIIEYIQRMRLFGCAVITNGHHFKTAKKCKR